MILSIYEIMVSFLSKCKKERQKRHKQPNEESHAYPGELFGVPQKDGPLLSDAVTMVELHQFVQRGEEFVPHIVLTAAILQHFEVLNMVPITEKKEGESLSNNYSWLIWIDH